MGLEIDLLNLMAAFMQKEVSFKTMPYDGLGPELKERSIDIATSSLSKSLFPKELFLFSHIFYAEPLYVITNKNITTDEDLINSKVALKKSKLSDKLSIILNRNLNTEITFEKTPTECLNLFISQKSDAIILTHMDYISIKAKLPDHTHTYFFDNPHNTNSLIINNPIFKAEISGLRELRGLTLAVHKEDRDLLNQINETLQTLNEHRAIESLLDKWKLIS